MQSGDEYDVSCRGHTGFDASMTSQKGDFRTNEALILKFGLLESRIPVKVMITQHSRYLQFCYCPRNAVKEVFLQVFLSMSMKKFSGADSMTC